MDNGQQKNKGIRIYSDREKIQFQTMCGHIDLSQKLSIPFIKNIKNWQISFVDGCSQEWVVFESSFSRIPKPSPIQQEETKMSFTSSYHPSPNEGMRYFGSGTHDGHGGRGAEHREEMRQIAKEVVQELAPLIAA